IDFTNERSARDPMRIKRLFAVAARFVSQHLAFPSFSGGLLSIPFEGTGYLRAFALLLATAVCWPQMARADTYPAQSGWYVNSGGIGMIASTQPAACEVWSSHNGGGWVDKGWDFCGGAP